MIFPQKNRTSENDFILKRFRLDTRKRFFPVRVVKPQLRLSGEAMAAPSLEVLEAWLDEAWRNLNLVSGSPAQGSELEIENL